jgi:hypothetical protein
MTMSETSEPNDIVPTPPDLGKVHKSYKLPRKHVSLLIFLSVLLVAGGITGAIMIHHPARWAALGAGCFLGIILLIGAVSLVKNELQLREFGIVRIALIGKKQLNFEQIQTIAYDTEDFFFNNDYTSTTHRLTVSGTNAKGKTITFRFDARADNRILEPLKQVREVVEQIICERMAHTLQESDDGVPWGDQVRITAGGIVSASGDLVPWDEITGCVVNKGVCLVRKKKTFDTVAEVPTHGPNFYPCFLVVTTYLDLAKEGDAEAE